MPHVSPADKPDGHVDEGAPWDERLRFKVRRAFDRDVKYQKKTRARREHVGRVRSMAWWPDTGPVEPKLRRKDTDDETLPSREWGLEENKGKQRYAARMRDWTGRPYGCPCCWGWIKPSRIVRKKEIGWMVIMYERGWHTLGMARGGKQRHPARFGNFHIADGGKVGPRWVDWEWNLEYGGVELDVVPGYWDKGEENRIHSEISIMDLVICKKVQRASSPEPTSLLAPLAEAVNVEDDLDWVPISLLSRGTRGISDDEWELCSLSSSVDGVMDTCEFWAKR